MRLGLIDPGSDGLLRAGVDIGMEAERPPSIKLLGERARVLWQAP